jgi:hypothetical protein
MEKCMGLLLWMRLVKITSLADYRSKAEKFLLQNTGRNFKKNRQFLPKAVIEKKIKKWEIVGLENNSR